MAALLRGMCWGSVHSSRTAAREGGSHTVARPGHVAVPLCESERVPTTRSHTGTDPNVFGGGTATLGRQDLPGRRAVKPEEVRALRPSCGNSAAPISLHARAALPSDPLLTLRGGLVWQENGPQLGHAADPREHLLRRPAGRRSSSPTWSRSAERRQLHRRLPWAGERHSHLARRQRLGGGPRLNLAAAPSS